MRERSNQSKLKLWVYLRANRPLLTAVVTILFFIAFIVITHFFFTPFREILLKDDTIDTLFAEILGAVITAVALVITISQLTISEEIGPLGEHRDRMNEAMEFRRSIRELIGEPAPAEPSTFIKKILDVNAERADALERAVEGNDDDDFRSQVEDLTDNIAENARNVSEEVEGTTFGTFDVLWFVLNYDYDFKLHHLERLLEEFSEDISDDEREAIEEMREALAIYSPAREHIKTLYFQWELIDLTQNLIFLTVPAMFIAGGMVGTVKPIHFPGAILGVSNILWAFGAAFALSLTPVFLFLVYILRIAVVAKRTLGIAPFLLRGSQL